MKAEVGTESHHPQKICGCVAGFEPATSSTGDKLPSLSYQIDLTRALLFFLTTNSQKRHFNLKLVLTFDFDHRHLPRRLIR